MKPQPNGQIELSNTCLSRVHLLPKPSLAGRSVGLRFLPIERPFPCPFRLRLARTGLNTEAWPRQRSIRECAPPARCPQSHVLCEALGSSVWGFVLLLCPLSNFLSKTHLVAHPFCSLSVVQPFITIGRALETALSRTPPWHQLQKRVPSASSKLFGMDHIPKRDPGPS